MRKQLAQLRGAAARLEGEAATAGVEIDKIRHEIGKRSIRAPQAGEVGEVIDLRVASLVREGDRLGTILAAGDIKVIADFAAASALGRVRLGQQAQVRLDGFPWTQYGMLTATVDRVATEPRAGRLHIVAASHADRVEIAVTDDGAGVDPGRVLEAAREGGLLAPEATDLADSEVLQLLFTTGFSTRRGCDGIF